MRWTSRSRATAASSSSSVRSCAAAPADDVGGRRAARLARIQARARCRNASTVLDLVGRLTPPSSRSLDEVGEALAVLAGRAVQRPVDGVPAQEEVQVVLEGDADAAVELHAVLQQLGAVLADVRLGRARPARRRRARRRATAAAAASLIAWLASSHAFMSAKRCLSAWYDASGRPNE